MAFRENLLQKIKIDELAAKVMASIGPDGGESKLDKKSMRDLLALSPYTPHRERDLDLYVNAANGGGEKVLVLDNELPIYRTSVQDVAMRKSPDVREMVSIRNVIKIIRDSDVKISRKVDSLRTVQAESIARLDLGFGAEDINDLRRDGIASLESKYAQGIDEALALFAELLGYRVPPKPFLLPQCTVYAALYRNEKGETVVGPAVAFDRAQSSPQADRGAIRRVRQGAGGAVSRVRGRARPCPDGGRGRLRTPPGDGARLACQRELTSACPRSAQAGSNGQGRYKNKHRAVSPRPSAFRPPRRTPWYVGLAKRRQPPDRGPETPFLYSQAP